MLTLSLCVTGHSLYVPFRAIVGEDCDGCVCDRCLSMEEQAQEECVNLRDALELNESLLEENAELRGCVDRSRRVIDGCWDIVPKLWERIEKDDKLFDRYDQYICAIRRSRLIDEHEDRLARLEYLDLDLSRD